MTTVGAAEGALIGATNPLSLALGPVLGAPLWGGVAGGVAGGLTALTTELIGRTPKRTVTVRQTVKQSFETTAGTQTITSDVSHQEQNVPLIQVPDTIMFTHLDAWIKANGDLRSWHWQTIVTKTPVPVEAVRAVKQKGITFSNT